jgi:hypothetical protein
MIRLESYKVASFFKKEQKWFNASTSYTGDLM